MNTARGLLVVAAAVATTAAGCAAAPPEAKGKSHAAEEILGGGGGGAEVDPNTFFMKVDRSSVYYDNRDGNALFVTICEDLADPALVRQIAQLQGQPTLVIQNEDGSFDTRVAEMPLHSDVTYYCPNGRSWEFHLHEQDGSFLRHVDLSSAFVSGFSGETVGCEGGFQLTQGLGLDVKNFKVENGALQAPQVTLTIDGQSTGQVQGRCFVKASTGPQWVMAGPVPVMYEVQILFGLSVALSKASSIHATIGTGGGSLQTDDPTFTFAPQLELGVVFYGVVGGYVGLDLPIQVALHPPCTPDVTMGASLKIGAQAGLLGVPGLPISKALSVEASTPVLGPFTLASSQCN